MVGSRYQVMADGRIYSQQAFDASPSYRAHQQSRSKFIWDFLKPAFDWGIAPTDIDGIVERNGNYLLFECKHNGKKISIGQARTLKDLNERHGFTIFVVEGFTADTISGLFVSWPRGVRKEPYKNVNSHFLLEKTRQWFDWADSVSAPTPTQKTPQEQTIEEWLRDYDNATNATHMN